ncbi:MAG: trk system potassium uptake protein TrkH [Algoriphagus sp.]
MKLKHYLVDFWDRLILMKDPVLTRFERAIFLVLFLAFTLVIYQIAFPKELNIYKRVDVILRELPLIIMLMYLGKWIIENFIRKNVKIFDRHYFPDLIFAGLLYAYLQLKTKFPLLDESWFLYMLLSIFFVVRVMREGSIFHGKKATPSSIFVVSFLMLIFVGTALLLIPDVSTEDLSFIDALFTATSAVCVTGLTVVDTSSAFSVIGQDVLLVLIQIGGLGLMTFTNFFAILFKGGMSFRNHLILSDIIQADKPNSLFGTLLKILGYTFIMELIGIFFIHFVSNETFFTSSRESWMFSIFHSISAFCNAGFSTLSGGLFNDAFRFNYPFQLVICFLVIFGGLGFPVMIDIYDMLKAWFRSFFRWLFFKERFIFLARNINVHSRLVLSTTGILLAVGTVLYFITEYNNSLLDHPSLFGKSVQAFFGSVTPRTAGFNTIDMGGMMQGTVLIYLLLMWIGSSPSSTGGGIKTTTFAIAISNIVSLARGKTRVDIFKREITSSSISRAFAVIFLSLLIIGLSVFLISVLEPDIELTRIAFECFSAYSTVGLSMNLTPELCTASKLVLIVTMFLGRVGMFTLLFGVFKKMHGNTHQFPKENVLIV